VKGEAGLPVTGKGALLTKSASSPLLLTFSYLHAHEYTARGVLVENSKNAGHKNSTGTTKGLFDPGGAEHHPPYLQAGRIPAAVDGSPP